MKKKVILILQRVNFSFQNTRQSKDYIFWMTCVGFFYQRSLIFKIFFKTDISLISFQQLDLIDMIFEIWDFIPEQEGLSNKIKNIDRVCEIRDKNDINSSQHSLKSWDSHGQYSGPWKGKTSTFSSAGGQRKMIKWRIGDGGQCVLKKDNQWMSTFRSHQGHYYSKTVHDLVNSNSNWKQHCTWGTTFYLHLGVTLWNMAMIDVIA